MGVNVPATGKDLTARDQIALLNMRSLINTAIATSVLVGGKQWELLTDEWSASSSNYSFVSAAINYYTGNLYSADLASGKTCTATTSAGGHGASLGVDGDDATYWQSSGGGGSAQRFNIDLGSAKTIRRLKLRSGYGSNAPGASSIDYSDDGVSWVTATALTIADTSAEQTFDFASAGSHRYWSIVQTIVTSDVRVYTAKLMDLSGSGDATLIPPASVSLSDVPAYLDAFFLWKDDSGSAVIGTDLTVDLSRDGGTTWTAATLTNVTGAGGFDGTYSVIKARASVASQPSGSSALMRVKTLNSKMQRIAAPALYEE